MRSVLTIIVPLLFGTVVAPDAGAADPASWPWVNGQIVLMPGYAGTTGLIVDCHEITVIASEATAPGPSLGWSRTATAFRGSFTSNTAPCVFNIQLPDTTKSNPHIQMIIKKPQACPNGVSVGMLTHPVLGPFKLPDNAKAMVGAFVVESVACATATPPPTK